MSSFVYIELDTTPPEVQVYSPSYTTKDLINTIIIESNEPTSDARETYVVDSNGVRHEFTFKKEEANLLIGEISFFGFPMGTVTIYVRLEDEVGNMSELVSRSIEIKETLSLLKLTIKDNSRELSIHNFERESLINNSCMNIDIFNGQREVF